MPETYRQETCFNGGTFGWLLWWIVELWPVFAWVQLYGRVFEKSARRRLYFSVYSNTYTFVWLFCLVLRDGFIRQPPPYPSCNNTSYAMPAWETAILLQYYVMAIVHHAYFHLPFRGKNVFFSCVTVVFVISVLWWNQNYTLLQLLAGAGLGVFFGLFMGYLVSYLFWPRIPFLRMYRWTQAWFESGGAHETDMSRYVDPTLAIL